MRFNHLSIPLLYTTSLALGCTPSPSDENSASSDEASALHDEMFQDGLDKIRANGIVAVHGEVLDGDRRILARSGTAQRDDEQPVDFDSYFRMGSNTKTFVSVVVLQLVGEGALTLDDPVDQWLPGVVSGNGNDGKRITIRQLLQHTSGLYNYSGEVEEGDPDPQPNLDVLRSAEDYLEHRLDQATAEELVALALEHEPRFAPGARWSYSNTNYVLAGMIIQRVTGNHWRSEVEARIIEPLGLDHTFEPGDEPELPSPHATAYQQFKPGEPLVDVTIANHTWADAAGSLVTTTADLARFWRALSDGSLLQPEQMSELRETLPAPDLDPIAPGAGYGLGIMWIPTSCGGGYWSHGGDTLGYSTRNAVNDDGSRVAVLSLSTAHADEEVAFATIKDSFQLLDQIMCAD
ncbi:serine hydrolase domain-containing protein [Sorangium sp. So ce1036]|uniref:serine hydrolase domain-containing protein n=1 Tax=Sorangium sp. So ce1036 TaxID=3133328 RepID=UPI003F1289BB